MKVIIDARMVDERLHGIARYTYELINGLLKKHDIVLKLLINNEEVANKVFGKHDNLSLIKMKSKFLSPLEQVELPYIVNKYKKEYIFHSPSFVSSPFIKTKSFITIHDLNHLALPQYYSKFHKYYYEFIVKPFALKCVKIFTVSEFSKGEIEQWLKCDPDKIVVTYNGIDDKFKKIKDKKILDEIKQKYNLPDKFVLYVGNLKPHKNVETIVKAMSRVNKDIKLVINGRMNDSIKNTIDEYRLQNRIKFIGYIDDDDLPKIYNLANVFVFVSLYEGFGLPPLEAMACGTTILVSNTTALNEVVDNKDFKVDPKNIDEIFKKINELVLFDKSSNSKFDYNKFRWEKLVDKTFENYFRREK